MEDAVQLQLHSQIYYTNRKYTTAEMQRIRASCVVPRRRRSRSFSYHFPALLQVPGCQAKLHPFPLGRETVINDLALPVQPVAIQVKLVVQFDFHVLLVMPLASVFSHSSERLRSQYINTLSKMRGCEGEKHVLVRHFAVPNFRDVLYSPIPLNRKFSTQRQ